jgi:phosphatidylglycerophosphate synthase
VQLDIGHVYTLTRRVYRLSSGTIETMTRVVDAIRQAIIRVVHVIALWLNKKTGGKLNPDAITILGFVMHAPIALLVASGDYWPLAGLLLVVFGLFDKLDGELARTQDRVTNNGGFLDAATDRLKEVLLYTAAGYWLAQTASPETAAWAVAACGVSLSVSYFKAKGEAVIASSGKRLPYPVLNKLFADGLMFFEVRIVVYIIGLISGYLLWALMLIAVLSSFTALKRLVNISRALKA